MTSNSTTPCLPQSETEAAVHLFDSWFDPIEAGLRDRVRDFLHAMFEGELDVLLSRPRYGRRGNRRTIFVADRHHQLPDAPPPPDEPPPPANPPPDEPPPQLDPDEPPQDEPP